MQSQQYVPPTLSEIQSGRVNIDSNGIRDLSSVTREEESELSKKKELLYKFEIIRKRNKSIKVPDFTEYSDLKTMQKEYDIIYRQIKVDKSVQSYRRFLIIAFWGLEMMLKNFANFDYIAGFAMEQTFKIDDYEELLSEIGEKNYLSETKQWPVELRLLGVVAMNAAFFVGGKMFTKATGNSELSETLNNLSSSSRQQYQSSPSPQTQQDEVPKKTKLKPPAFQFEDIADKKIN